MSIVVKVDMRETSLLEQMQLLISVVPSFKGVTLQTVALPIGDVVLSTVEGVDLVILERKCVADLIASIKDGRYEEQSYRLNGLPHANHNVVYLIEGDVKGKHKSNPAERMMLYSAMFSLNYYKGFSVMRTFSVEESAFVLCNMAYKLQKEGGKRPFYTTETTPLAESVSEKDYVGVVKKVKKDNVTASNIGEIMLCQIPHISATIATAVMERFQSLGDLLKALETDRNALKDLTFVNAKGQVRKINKNALASIADYLVPLPPTNEETVASSELPELNPDT